jgi:colicin import membrane protein
MASTVSTTQLMEEAREAVGRLSGPQQLALVAEILGELNGVVGGKSAKLAAGGGAASVASSAKKAPTDAQQRWRDGIKEVQRLVREHADEDFAYGAAMKVASKVKLHEDFPMPPWEGVVEEAYGEWLAEQSEGGSTATKSAKTAAAPKKKLADMSEPERKAFYKARAQKAAATKAAKKAAAAEAEAEADESEEEVVAKPPPKVVRKPAAAAGGGGGAGAARPPPFKAPLVEEDEDEEEWA